MPALAKEVKSLDEDNWMFQGPRSRINHISKPGGFLSKQSWPEPDHVGRQELEIVMGNEHISFTTSKIGSLMDVQTSKDPEGLRIFYYLVQEVLPEKSMEVDKVAEVDKAMEVDKTIWTMKMKLPTQRSIPALVVISIIMN
ncbi:hypothetical protein POM88_045710 [Heracleum sosnowskyi]|uniref:Uncharacterized protein n=1 Tax=Heracleum sosnowskyi TaxID=360622 RepID=A0AAD8H6F2_9APIA|nr:hypothetical protein POM88_045710 [Heracleum sosnowskyi]